MLILMLAGMTAAIVLLVQLDRCIRPLARDLCIEESRRYASQIMSRCIEEILAENPHDYEDFAELLYDESGNITAVETKSRSVNILQTALLSGLNETLDACRDEELGVSLGTASGVWLFAGAGPSVPLRLLPIGSAKTELVSTLESAGINQTCHKIHIRVTAQIAASIPFCRTETEVALDYLLCETLLVGEIPETYAVLAK